MRGETPTSVTTYEQEFPGTPEAVARVREWAAGLVSHTGREAEIVLAISEMAANAVLHSMSGAPGGTFVARITIVGSTVTLVLIDQGPLLIPRPRRPVEESGRGLPLVAEVSSAFARHGNKAIAVFECFF